MVLCSSIRTVSARKGEATGTMLPAEPECNPSTSKVTWRLSWEMKVNEEEDDPVPQGLTTVTTPEEAPAGTVNVN